MINRFPSEHFLREEMKTAVRNATIASYMGVRVEACHGELFSNLEVVILTQGSFTTALKNWRSLAQLVSVTA